MNGDQTTQTASNPKKNTESNGIITCILVGFFLISGGAVGAQQPRQPTRPPDRPNIDISSPPRITGLRTFADQAYYGEDATLFFKIENMLGRKVTKIEVLGPLLTFIADSDIFGPEIQYTSGVRNEETYFKHGKFRRDPCPGNLCPVRLKVTLFYAGKTQVFELDAGTVAVAPLQEYRIENTRDLMELLSFRPVGIPVGACSGRSDFPGQNSFMVGMLDGGQDLAFRIRSGPIGTECYWRSNWLQLKEFWEVRSLEWEMKKDKTRCLVSNMEQTYLTIPINPNFIGTTRIIPAEDAVYVGFETVHASDSLWGGKDVSRFGQSPLQIMVSGGNYGKTKYMRPMMIVLNCAATPLNDNGVETTLKSVTLAGPPNMKWKDGVKSAFITLP